MTYVMPMTHARCRLRGFPPRPSPPGVPDETGPVRRPGRLDSLTLGIGDPMGGGWRGWAALLAPSPADGPVEFTNLATSGVLPRDVLERQTPHALACGRTWSPSSSASTTPRVGASTSAPSPDGSTMPMPPSPGRVPPYSPPVCPTPGPCSGSPCRSLARPLARRQRAVNAVVHALSVRHGALHTHVCEGA